MFMHTDDSVIFVLYFFNGCNAGSFVTLPFKSNILPWDAQNNPVELTVNGLSWCVHFICKAVYELPDLTNKISYSILLFLTITRLFFSVNDETGTTSTPFSFSIFKTGIDAQALNCVVNHPIVSPAAQILHECFINSLLLSIFKNYIQHPS